MNNRQTKLLSFIRPFVEFEMMRPYMRMIGLQVAVTFLGTLLITSSFLA